MVKKYFVCAFVGFILLFLTAEAFAWDGQRKGFLLGFGVGLGMTSFTQKVSWSDYHWQGSARSESPGEEKAEFMKCLTVGFPKPPPPPSYYQEVSLTILGESPREDKAAFMSDFKIGYAPNNSWAIYYTSKISWFGITNVRGNDVTIANGLGALGVSYWFKLQAPSPFIAGGLGYSTWALPFEDNPPDAWMGFGLFAGGGYEFSRHVSIEGYLSWGKPKHEEFGIEVSSSALSLMLTVNVLGY